MRAAIELSENIEQTTGDDVTVNEHTIFQDEPDGILANEQTISGNGGLITPKPKEVAAPPMMEGTAPQATPGKRTIMEVAGWQPIVYSKTA